MSDNDRGRSSPGGNTAPEGRYRRSKKNKTRCGKGIPPIRAFEGDCADLKGHTFVLSGIRSKKRIKSKEVFIDYVETQYEGDKKALVMLMRILI